MVRDPVYTLGIGCQNLIPPLLIQAHCICAFCAISYCRKTPFRSRLSHLLLLILIWSRDLAKSSYRNICITFQDLFATRTLIFPSTDGRLWQRRILENGFQHFSNLDKMDTLHNQILNHRCSIFYISYPFSFQETARAYYSTNLTIKSKVLSEWG